MAQDHPAGCAAVRRTPRVRASGEADLAPANLIFETVIPAKLGGLALRIFE
jgi:hypothetical protein